MTFTFSFLTKLIMAVSIFLIVTVTIYAIVEDMRDTVNRIYLLICKALHGLFRRLWY